VLVANTTRLGRAEPLSQRRSEVTFLAYRKEHAVCLTSDGMVPKKCIPWDALFFILREENIKRRLPEAKAFL